MNKKTFYLGCVFIFLSVFAFAELVYLKSTKSMTEDMRDKKNVFVSLVKLPDLAISTEATYVRHRSISDMFCIYKDDPTLREYFVSTYAISHSKLINPHAKTGYEK